MKRSEFRLLLRKRRMNNHESRQSHQQRTLQ
jgi:hypothetical protein